MNKVHYEPWRQSEWPRLQREVVGIHWESGVRIDVAESWGVPASIEIMFPRTKAFQGIDEGYRLRDIPIGSALIYVARESPYLAAFRHNASNTMDSFPLLHWLVISANQCVDVLSEGEPEVRVTHDV
jgi:hypothetical protein